MAKYTCSHIPAEWKQAQCVVFKRKSHTGKNNSANSVSLMGWVTLCQKRSAPLPQHTCLGIIASDFPWFRVYTEKENVRICPELGILNVIFKAWGKKSKLFIAGKGVMQFSHSMWVPSSVVQPQLDLSMATPWKAFPQHCQGTVHIPLLQGPGSSVPGLGLPAEFWVWYCWKQMPWVFSQRLSCPCADVPTDLSMAEKWLVPPGCRQG